MNMILEEVYHDYMGNYAGFFVLKPQCSLWFSGDTSPISSE